MKFLYLLLLVPMLAFGTGGDDNECRGNPHNCNNGGDDVTTITVDNSSSAEVDVDVTNSATSTSSSNSDSSSTSSIGNVENTSVVEASASTAYAYAAQCGTAGGVSAKDFSVSSSGESQYCKHLRISSFYEGLYITAVERNDNVMAQVWYDAMVVEISTAQTLIDSTSFTGSVKETAGDLLLPTMLCGGLAAVATPAAGYICAAGLGIKGASDHKKVKDREKEVKDSLDIRNTDHTKMVQCTPDTCAYINGVLHHYRD